MLGLRVGIWPLSPYSVGRSKSLAGPGSTGGRREGDPPFLDGRCYRVASDKARCWVFVPSQLQEYRNARRRCQSGGLPSCPLPLPWHLWIIAGTRLQRPRLCGRDGVLRTRSCAAAKALAERPCHVPGHSGGGCLVGRSPGDTGVRPVQATAPETRGSQGCSWPSLWAWSDGVVPEASPCSGLCSRWCGTEVLQPTASGVMAESGQQLGPSTDYWTGAGARRLSGQPQIPDGLLPKGL